MGIGFIHSNVNVAQSELESPEKSESAGWPDPEAREIRSSDSSLASGGYWYALAIPSVRP